MTDLTKILDKPSVMLFVGKPGKGKSNSIKWFILSHTIDKEMYKFGLCFTRTKFNGDYDYIDPKFVHSNYNENTLKQYLDKLINEKENGKEIPRNFVIFDDLIGLLTTRDSFIINFFGTHRHTNTDIYLATQHLNTGASTTLREITTYAILFGSKQKNTIRSLHENFGQLFDTEKEFKEHYFKTTKEPYTAMFYNNRIEDMENNYLAFKTPDMSKYNVKLKFNSKAAPEEEKSDENPHQHVLDPAFNPETISAQHQLSGTEFNSLMKYLDTVG